MKKILALGLSGVLCFSSSISAFAYSDRGQFAQLSDDSTTKPVFQSVDDSTIFNERATMELTQYII